MPVQLALVAEAHRVGRLRDPHAAPEHRAGARNAEVCEVRIGREPDLGPERAREVELVEPSVLREVVEGDHQLFTACAAYCYARSAALGTRKTDEIITAEINAAYDRQRRLSQEKP